MKAFRCGGPDGAPSDGDGTTLARAAARFREQQPKNTSLFEAKAPMHPNTNIFATMSMKPFETCEFGGAGSTLSGAMDSAEGWYTLCGAKPETSRRSCKEPSIFAMSGPRSPLAKEILYLCFSSFSIFSYFF